RRPVTVIRQVRYRALVDPCHCLRWQQVRSPGRRELAGAKGITMKRDELREHFVAEQIPATSFAQERTALFRAPSRERTGHEPHQVAGGRWFEHDCVVSGLKFRCAFPTYAFLDRGIR